MAEMPKEKAELIEIFIQKLEVNFKTASIIYEKGYDSLEKLFNIELEALADIDEIDISEAKNIYQNAHRLEKQIEAEKQLAAERKAREEEIRSKPPEEPEPSRMMKHVDRLITPVDEIRGRIMDKTKEVMDTIAHPPKDLPEEEKIVVIAAVDDDEDETTPAEGEARKPPSAPEVSREDAVKDFMSIKGISKKEADFLYDIGYDGVAHLIHDVVRQEWQLQRKDRIKKKKDL